MGVIWSWILCFLVTYAGSNPVEKNLQPLRVFPYIAKRSDGSSVCENVELFKWNYAVHECFINRKYKDGGQDLNTIVDRIMEHGEACMETSSKECRPDFQGFTILMNKTITQMKDYAQMYLEAIYKGREDINDLDCVEIVLNIKTYENCFRNVVSQGHNESEETFKKAVKEGISCANRRNSGCSKEAKTVLNRIVRIILGVEQPSVEQFEEEIKPTDPPPAPMMWYDYLAYPFIQAWRWISELNMMTFGKKLLTISSLVICIWIVIGMLIYRSTIFSSPHIKIHSVAKTVEDEIEACKSKDQKLSPVFWRKINYLKNEIPEEFKKLVNEVEVHSNFTLIHDSKVHYLYVKPSNKKNLSVLLLHGQSFTSDTWNKLHTIQYIGAFGYFAVAVDLPGYGSSPTIENLKRVEFLSSVIDSLNMENVVIISPSMSGMFSLEFLMKHPEKLSGFIPVSPVSSQILNQSPCKGPDNYTGLYFDRDCQKVLPFLKSNPPVLNCIKVPTLVVFGEHDKTKSSARLCLLPNSQGAEIPNDYDKRE
ncbi:Protein ABHD14A like protein [Argiope bruennichi]|uniref:Protein ABHD14A like protein n=1 Tax=Argiope bruennichi TaxID=94029 RepID=A0A8T0ESH7_ARGBR|nr:Protein ABHD14A like protein [Argiope bruennichi]